MLYLCEPQGLAKDHRPCYNNIVHKSRKNYNPRKNFYQSNSGQPEAFCVKY